MVPMKSLVRTCGVWCVVCECGVWCACVPTRRLIWYARERLSKRTVVEMAQHERKALEALGHECFVLPRRAVRDLILCGLHRACERSAGVSAQL
jgi:hypothetical protein